MDTYAQPPVTPVDLSSLQRRAIFASLAAATFVLGAVLVGAVTGWAPEHFQTLTPAGEFTNNLALAGEALKISLVIDAGFMAAYLVLFLTLYSLWRERGPLVAAVAVGAMVSTLVLDVVENQLLLSAIADVGQGGVISDGQVYLHAMVSQTKFHIGYFGLFLFGLLVPTHTLVGRLMRNVLLYVQLPVGVLVFIVPGTGVAHLRSAFFVVGLLIFAWINRPSPAARALTRQ